MQIYDFFLTSQIIFDFFASYYIFCEYSGFIFRLALLLRRLIARSICYIQKISNWLIKSQLEN